MDMIEQNKAKEITTKNVKIKGSYYMFGKDPHLNFDHMEALLKLKDHEANTWSDRTVKIKEIKQDIKNLLTAAQAIKLRGDEKNNFIDNGHEVEVEIGGSGSDNVQGFDKKHLDPASVAEICARLQIGKLGTDINGTSRQEIALAAEIFKTLLGVEVSKQRGS